MEVVTKVACGSVIAGGGGAVGAYGVHRISVVYEKNEDEKTPPLVESESNVTDDTQKDSTTHEETGTPDQPLKTPPESPSPRPEGGDTQTTSPGEGKPGSEESPTKPAQGAESPGGALPAGSDGSDTAGNSASSPDPAKTLTNEGGT